MNTQDINTDTVTPSEFVKYMYQEDAPQRIFDSAYRSQHRDLEWWKLILKEEVFRAVMNRVHEKNKEVRRPDDVVRGNAIQSIILNLKMVISWK